MGLWYNNFTLSIYTPSLLSLFLPLGLLLPRSHGYCDTPPPEQQQQDTLVDLKHSSNYFPYYFCVVWRSNQLNVSLEGTGKQKEE